MFAISIELFFQKKNCCYKLHISSHIFQQCWTDLGNFNASQLAQHLFYCIFVSLTDFFYAQNNFIYRFYNMITKKNYHLKYSDYITMVWMLVVVVLQQNRLKTISYKWDWTLRLANDNFECVQCNRNSNMHFFLLSRLVSSTTKRIITFIGKKTFMALSNNKNWIPTTIAKKIDNNKNIVINGWNAEKNAVFQFE